MSIHPKGHLTGTRHASVMRQAISPRHPHALARFAAGRRFIAPHALPVYGLCVLGMIAVAAAVASGAFSYDPAFATNLFQSSLAVLCLAWTTRWIGFAGMADGVEQVLLLFVAGIICAFCAVICASSAAPLADAMLQRADMLVFGIDRATLIADLHMTGNVVRLWMLAYNSFTVTPWLAMVLLIWRGQRWRAWAVLTAMMICAALMVLCLLITPAVGTPPYPYAFETVLAGVRSGELRTLDTSVITGLVTFPSMHAADAVILAVAFGWLGRWAAPLILLNVIMFFSALVVGGHYAVDLVAGGLAGVASLGIALWMHRRIEATTT